MRMTMAKGERGSKWNSPIGNGVFECAEGAAFNA